MSTNINDPTPINFPVNVDCCNSTLSAANKTTCSSIIRDNFKQIEQLFQPNLGALYIFYKGKDFSGQPIGYKYKDTISIVDEDSPSIQKDNFCCRIISYLNIPKDDDYQFQISADAGARVFINNSLIINTFDSYWNTTVSPIPISNKIKLYANFPYLLVIEFTEDKGVATLDFKYLNNTTTKYESIPNTWVVPFKPYSDTYSAYDNAMANYCAKLDSKNIGNYQTKELCNTYLINNAAPSLVKTITDYCTMGDNMTSDYCSKPSSDIINFSTTNNLNSKDPNVVNYSKSKYNNTLIGNLISGKITYCAKKIVELNYTDNYSINFYKNEIIPNILKTTNNDISKLYDVLSRELKLVTPELINFVETKDPELTNSFLKYIYDLFKNVDKNPIRYSWIKIMTQNCQQTNKDNELRYQVEDQCKSFLKTNTELNKTVLDYCNADNIQGKYCSDLDDLIINNRVNKVDLPVNADLSNNINIQRINLNKTKLIDSKYTDDSAIKYFNNQFKQLTDLETDVNKRTNRYNEIVLTPDALKYCEDNYLDTENKFCKPTLMTYNTQQNTKNTLNKIKEQTCLYNNNFVNDKNCNEYSNQPENYNKFIKANNTYCSTDENIANEYCQSYYKNVETNLNNQLLNGSCTKMSAFENKESFENDNLTISLIIFIICIILFVSILGIKKVYNNNNSNLNLYKI